MQSTLCISPRPPFPHISRRRNTRLTSTHANNADYYVVCHTRRPVCRMRRCARSSKRTRAASPSTSLRRSTQSPSRVCLPCFCLCLRCTLFVHQFERFFLNTASYSLFAHCCLPRFLMPVACVLLYHAFAHACAAASVVCSMQLAAQVKEFCASHSMHAALALLLLTSSHPAR